jgi:hypothetical protein
VLPGAVFREGNVKNCDLRIADLEASSADFVDFHRFGVEDEAFMGD